MYLFYNGKEFTVSPECQVTLITLRLNIEFKMEYFNFPMLPTCHDSYDRIYTKLTPPRPLSTEGPGRVIGEKPWV